MNSLSLYARSLSKYPYISHSQKRLFLIFVHDLENTRNKWQSGVGRCLSRDDIGVLYKFGNLITGRSINHYLSHNSIYDRLAKIWVYLLNVPDNLVPDVVTGRSQISSSSVPSLNLDRSQAAKENSSLMIKAVIERNNSNNNLLLLDIPTILLTIIMRSEAHEYTLGKILGRIQKVTKDQVDIADLLSVESRVHKGNGVKPDTRAIRDATAHARFIIRRDYVGDFAIHFNNTDDGYSFQRVYSRKELLNFYQDYDRMTIITTRLLVIRLLYSFLNLYFLMD